MAGFYPTAATDPDFPAIERAVLKRWEKNGTFQKSLGRRPAEVGGSSNEFVFYDGPPFANGLPHYGHIATGFVKDIVPRYQTMRGRHVDRRFGWDCHGLPAELEVEKELQVFGRAAIEEYGVGPFNQACRRSVLRYAGDWRTYVDRQARWVSFDRAYRTMDRSFMESVLWAFKELWRKGLIYEDYRVVPYSWAVQSPLSNFETRLDNAYRDRTDPALTVAFHLDPEEADCGCETVLVAWTTTPWTLPANLALAVNPALDYAVLERDGVRFILAAAALPRYRQEFGSATVVAMRTGREIAGRTYRPLFPYFADTPGAFRVLPAGFVSADDGTGVVHIAPGFGEDDLALGRAHDLPVVVPVDEAGRFTGEVSDYCGLNVIHEGNPQIIRDLKSRRDGTVVRHDQIVHAYPHCWRTDEPLIYRAINGWYVAVSRIRDRMVELNRTMSWTPGHVRDGSFGKWLENARDWNISRNRFWGTPIPVWKSDDPAWPRVDVYGSVDELERDFGVRVDDLHRPMIDELTRPNPDDPTGRSTMRRVTDVLDCWFESGSMPFAQLHYPFENRERFDRNFPGDFIVEYVAQTRGWFYTLMVLATALFDRAPFRHCICHGVVLDDRNQKLSKRLRNYPDPIVVFETHGADALRWYLMSSPLMAGGNLSMRPDGTDIGRAVRPVILRLWNAYVFFTTYANLDGVRARQDCSGRHPLDRYILAKTRELCQVVGERLDAFDVPGAYAAIEPFVDALNNWYIRHRRGAFWSDVHDGDKESAYNTLYSVLTLVCRILAPLMPLIADHIHGNLTGEESVHLTDWPDLTEDPGDQALVKAVDLAREVCRAVLTVREANRIRVRIPLSRLTVAHPATSLLACHLQTIADEVNVKEVILSASATDFGTREIRVDPAQGKILGARMKDIFAAQRAGDWRLREDGSAEIAGEILMPGQFETRLRIGDGLAAEPFDRDRGVVVLDLTLTADLRAEGWGRDLIRFIQQARKDCRLELTDRIAVTVQSGGAVRDAFIRYRDRIMRETLATRIDFDHDLTQDSADVVCASLDGETVRLKVRRLGG
ncbi:MAG: isoleucine--tRNA ligase [Telmatospirillum sp.]|nr:isoleucine--tRNA ligase [Telmatospirillum sp.]